MAAARILLADDDRELSELLTRFLVREGFSVEPVFDGEAALRRALSEPYDALVLDIMMPVRSGLDVLRDLRAATTLPVLMLTALGDDVDRILGLEIGADDYLTKPCNPHELAARIRAVLRRARRDEGDSPRFADMHIGAVEFRVGPRTALLHGQALNLTTSEFNILAVLMREAGRGVSKEMLAEAALGRALSPFDRSIDVHISRLRRKLGSAADGQSRVATLHGSGYLFRRVSE